MPNEREHPDELVHTLHPAAYWKGLDRCLSIVQKEIKRLQLLERQLLIAFGVKPEKASHAE